MKPKFLAASEFTYYVGGDGEVKKGKLKTRTSNNLMFSLKAFAETFGLPLSFDKGGKNWQYYTKALKIRDRITHPKNIDDINITDEDIEVIREAKGMIIGYLSILSSSKLIDFLKEKREYAMEKKIALKFTLDEEDLKKFGIE